MVKVDTSIKAGDFVRSYDFPMHLEMGDLEQAEQCYVEGIVEKITDVAPGEDGFNRQLGYHVYVINVTREVFSGEVVKRSRKQICAPVNGTPQIFSKYPTHGVHKL